MSRTLHRVGPCRALLAAAVAQLLTVPLAVPAGATILSQRQLLRGGAAAGTPVAAIPPPAAPPEGEKGPLAPPPPPPTLPPPTVPPKFPTIEQADCKLFERAFLLSPPAVCNHAVYASNWDGCTCNVIMPGNMNPMPDTLYNPYAISMVPDPSLPTFAPIATIPPPSNPLMPYAPPPRAPECPFVASCKEDAGFGCVGYNTWGFAEAHMSPYVPAQSHFNSISCSYVMKIGGKFEVPKKVAAFYHMQDLESAKESAASAPAAAEF